MISTTTPTCGAGVAFTLYAMAFIATIFRSFMLPSAGLVGVRATSIPTTGGPNPRIPHARYVAGGIRRDAGRLRRILSVVVDDVHGADAARRVGHRL